VLGIGKMRNVFRILVGKLHGNKVPMCIWEDNIKMDLQRIRCEEGTRLKWLWMGFIDELLS